MQLRFLIGPAGSGKTFRCLSEIRQELLTAPSGSPLWLVAPRQATYQLEEQLLGGGSLSGYTRLHVLSFERLAQAIFGGAGKPPPRMLNEEGRIMVLRALLLRLRHELKLFRASARLAGFARQLSHTLTELQGDGLTPQRLRALATEVSNEGLSSKLHDFAILLEAYLSWLREHQLDDAESLLPRATDLLKTLPNLRAAKPPVEDTGIQVAPKIWIDGFSEFSEQELGLLSALVPRCETATITFSFEQTPSAGDSWFSSWPVTRRAFETCRRALQELPGVMLETVALSRKPAQNRFAGSPVLKHLELAWTNPDADLPAPKTGITESLRIVSCLDQESEVLVAAHEILRHVRAGGRFRQIMVAVRKLDLYHHPLRRIFSRYEIPFFLDRRESVAHHPLAEVTRNALRTVAFEWRNDDWFSALKTGLLPASENEIDQLENEAMAAGWEGSVWQKPLMVEDDPARTEWVARLLKKILPPFQQLALSCKTHNQKLTGKILADALRQFWHSLRVEEQLEAWAAEDVRAQASAETGAVHATVWDQMNGWLQNVEMAFSDDALALRDWLPVLEAGLSNLTVGIIPPALDQVLIGPVDRSRNPEVQLSIVLGLNEGIFPALPEKPVLLTDSDRELLQKSQVILTANHRLQMARERHYGYIAFTRASRRLVLTCALQDVNGDPLHPSPFLDQLHSIFPTVPREQSGPAAAPESAEHVQDLVRPLLLALQKNSGPLSNWRKLATLPRVAAALRFAPAFNTPSAPERLRPELASKLYGPILRTSVTRIEQYAACPFKFFVNSGLKAEERDEFKVDVKEQGSFQHEALALFHDELISEGKKWSDLSPREARARMGNLALRLKHTYRNGLLEATDRSKFLARFMTESLQDFVETVVGWMQTQYRFNPAEVELPFGDGENSPAWELDLGQGRKLALHGQIDRVDLCPGPNGETFCLVLDYKSSQKKLDALSLKHGLQLQLLAYLAVLRHSPAAGTLLKAAKLVPAGVFYINLRGLYKSRPTRGEALADTETARRAAYRHSGRFDRNILRFLDATGAESSDQFNYRLAKSGELYANSTEAVSSEEFAELLDLVEHHLKTMGEKIFGGVVEIAPFRRGAVIACDQCGYQGICRIDKWTHSFRLLQ